MDFKTFWFHFYDCHLNATLLLHFGESVRDERSLDHDAAAVRTATMNQCHDNLFVFFSFTFFLPVQKKQTIQNSVLRFFLRTHTLLGQFNNEILVTRINDAVYEFKVFILCVIS